MPNDLLEGHEPPVNHDDMLRELEREIEVRQRVYPRWVASGKLEAGVADRRIAVLEATRDLVLNVRSRGARSIGQGR